MKTKLLISALLVCLFSLSLQAENSFSGDTISIPWTEGFESISYTNEMPHGMSCTLEGTTRYVYTYTSSPETYSPPSSSYYYRFARTGTKFAVFNYHLSGGDWIFSPATFLRAGNTYYFSFWYITSTSNIIKGLEAKVGLSPTREGMVIQVGDSLVDVSTNQYKKYEGSFTPAKDDFYYFGIYAVGTAFLSVDDLELNTIPTTPAICIDINPGIRNVTDSSAEVYWKYSPAGSKGFILNYKSTRSTTWTSEFLSPNILSRQFSNLSDSIDVKLGTICRTGDTLWHPQIETIKRLKTPTPPSPIPTPFGKFPIDEKFDGTSGIEWRFRNDSLNTSQRNYNKWYIGKPKNMPESGRDTIAYISSDKGLNNIYSYTYAGTTHLYTEFILPENKEDYMFSFDWRSFGDSVSKDYLRVTLMDTSINTLPKNGELPNLTAAYIYRLFAKDLRRDSVWKTESTYLDNSISGRYKKLVFTWTNANNSAARNPPAAIDNIVFKTACGVPRNLTWKDNIDGKTLLLSCKANAANVAFNIAYCEEQSQVWSIQQGAFGDNKDSLVLGNLLPNTVYEVKMQRKCETGDTSIWSESIKVSTGVKSTEVPFTDNFEDFETERRGFVNGTVKNKWQVGNAVNYNDAGKSLYISDNDGTNWRYNDTAEGIVHAYYDIAFPEGENFMFSFDWKGIGAPSDVMSVFLVDINVHPKEGEMLSSNARLFTKDFYNRHTTWLHEELLLPKELSKTKKRLVFTWRNSGNGNGAQPPVAIDNVSIQKFDCAVPQYLKTVGANTTTVTFMSEKLETVSSYNLNYRKDGSDIWLSKIINPVDIINGYLFTLKDLDINTFYEFRLQRQCSASNASVFTETVKARTTAIPAQIPFTENFELKESYSKWMTFNGNETNRWVVFDSVHHGENSKKALYISTGDERNAYKYNTDAASIVHFSRDIEFPAAYEYELYFDWKGIGNENNYLLVYIDGINNNAEAGSINLSGAVSNGKHYYGSGEWQRDTIILPATKLQNKIGRLTFTWKNEEGGTQPPIAIDNIELRANKCPMLTDLTMVSYPNDDAVELRFTRQGYSNAFVVSYTDENNTTETVNVTSTNPTVSGLQPNTVYTMKVQNNCGENLSPWSDALIIRTPQRFAELPFTETFEKLSSHSEWTFMQGAASNDSINKWFIGTASHHPQETNDKYALYIDALDGSSNFAANNYGEGGAGYKQTTIVHVYRDVKFPETNNDITLSFDWKNWGTTGKSGNRVLVHAAFIVSIIDLEKSPNVGSCIDDYPQLDIQESWSDQYPVIYQKTMYATDDLWHDTTIFLPTHLLSGKKKRLVYTWYNYAYPDLKQPPVSIDNIRIVAAACPTPKNVTYTLISSDSVKLQWECDANPIVNNFKVQYNSNFFDETTLNTSNKETILKGLKANTVYQVTIVNECEGANNTPVSINFRTPQTPITLPFYETFFDLGAIAEWSFVNGTKINQWYAGASTAGFGSGKVPISAAYISSDDGYSNIYSVTDPNPGVVHLYKEITFPDKDEFVISFDWRCMGESSFDFMSVYLADNSVIPIAGTEIDSAYNIISTPGRLNLQNQWKNEITLLDGAKYKNTKKKLIFSWKNNSSGGAEPPAAFSNLTIDSLGCVTPKNLRLVKCLNDTSAIIAWDSIKGINNYLLRYSESSEISAGYSWDSVKNIVRNFDTLKSLRPNGVAYEVQVKNPCGGADSWTKIMTFNTQQGMAELPFVEDFEDVTDRKNWTIVNGEKLNKWHIDMAVHDAGKINHAAYISNDDGATNSYTGTDPQTSLVHIYRDIRIKPNQKEFQMTFDWKGLAQGYYYYQIFHANYDFLNVYLVNEDSIPTAGVRYSDSARIFYKNIHSSKVWKTEQIILPLKNLKRLKGERNRLVFMWYNSVSGGNQPPIAIDNIFVNTSDCLTPSVLSRLSSTDTARFLWKTNGENWSSYNLRYKKIGGDEAWKEIIGITDTFYTLRNLEENGLYEIRLQTQCNNVGDTSLWLYDTVKMRQRTASIPFDEDFEDEDSIRAWNVFDGSTYKYPLNSWFIGKAAGGSKGSQSAAYISDSNGLTHRYEPYTPSVTIISHLYRDIKFPTGVKEYYITFDWKNMGNGNYAYLYASFIDSAATLAPGASDRIAKSNLYDSINWNTWTGFLPESFSGKTKRLVFTGVFGNTSTLSYINQPPPAVDNIRIIALDCKTPDTVRVIDYPDPYSASLTWGNLAKGDTFTIAYRKLSETNWHYAGFKTKPATLTGLDSNTVYQVKVENSCGAAVIWSNLLEIQTPRPPIKDFPFEETFDSGNADNWLVLNGAIKNQWHVGKLYDKDGTVRNVMYVSDDNGVSNNYNISSPSMVYFYRDVQFPTEGPLKLTFSWKGMGYCSQFPDYCNDYMMVYLADLTVTPIASTSSALPTNILGKYQGSIDWQTATIIFPDSLKGKTRRLGFVWKNVNSTVGVQPPIAIENIRMEAYVEVCGRVANLKAEASTDKKAKVTWSKGISGTTDYTLEYKLSTAYTWISQQVSDTVCLLENLVGGSSYNVRVRINCEEGNGQYTQITFMPPYSLDFFENFTSNSKPPVNWDRRGLLLDWKSDAMKLITSSPYWGIVGLLPETFANIPGESSVIRVEIKNSTLKDWLITPPIYLDSSDKFQIEFNLALTSYFEPEGIPSQAGIDKVFGVFVSADSVWSMKDNLAIWDNKGRGRSFNNISHTLAGSKVKLLLDKYQGRIVKFAFYIESTVNNVINKLFLDSLLITPYKCKEVSSVKVADIGLDKATIKWNSADADQYQWKIRYGLQDNPNELQEINATEINSLKLQSLDTNKTYHVFVRSICDTVESNWKTISFVTLSPCDAVDEESISVTTADTSATISWDAGSHLSWELRYGLAGTSLSQMQTVYPASPTFNINGLTEQTQYGYYVRGVCGVNDTSHWSTQNFFTTKKTVCPGIFEITVSDITTNSATIAWSAPTGQRQWEVRYGTESISINAMKSYFTVEKTLPTSSLQVNATYEIVVRSICRADDSSLWSARKQFTTQDCGTVSNLLVVKNTNGNSAELSWTAKPEHTKWRIGIDTNNNFSTAREEEITENPYTIDYAHWSIEKTKSYYISIKALCGSHLVDTWSDQAVLTKGEGIDDLDNARIQVNLSPNPANDYTKLSIFGAEGVVNVQIYSVKGELILTEKLNCIPENTKDLVIKGLQRGAYTLRIVHEKWTRTEKLIMQ